MLKHFGFKHFLILVAIHNAYYSFYKNPSGLSFDKILLLIAIIYFIITSVSNKSKFSVSGIGKLLLILFLGVCSLSFVRGVITGLEQDRFQNAFNPIISLCVVVPFTLFMSTSREFSLKILFQTMMILMKIGIVLVLTSLAFKIDAGIIKPFIDPVFFLIIFLNLNIGRKQKSWIIVGILCYLYYGIAFDSRTIVLRVFLQIALLLMFKYGEQIFKYLFLRKIVFAVIVLMPFLGLTYYYSFFNETNVSIGSNSISNEDTRTFLYVEVVGDLTKTENIFLGKGTLGTYFSTWFYQQMGVDDVVDTFNRSLVEVGVLSYLLRGGLLLASLFILLMLFLSSKALLVNDIKVRAIAYILLNHVLISFIENIPRFFIYDVILWLFVGYLINRVYKSKDSNNLAPNV